MQEELAAEAMCRVVRIICYILGPPGPDMQLCTRATCGCICCALPLQLDPEVVWLAITQLINLQVSLRTMPWVKCLGFWLIPDSTELQMESWMPLAKRMLLAARTMLRSAQRFTIQWNWV